MRGCIPLTRSQVKKVLGLADNFRDKLMVFFGVCTGFRISEILSVRIKDVSTNGIIHDSVTVQGRNMKNKETRSVVITEKLKKMLHKYIKVLHKKGLDKNTPIFLSNKKTIDRQSKAITRQHAWAIIKDLFAKIDLTCRVGTHSLRKTFAKLMYDKLEGKLEKIQCALGHKRITSTVLYLSFEMSEVDNAVASISDLLDDV